MVRPEAAGEEPKLVLHLDQAAIVASQRRLRARLRRALPPGRVPPERRPGLVLLPTARRPAAGRNLVVTIHGLESRPEAVEASLSEVPTGQSPGRRSGTGTTSPLSSPPGHWPASCLPTRRSIPTTAFRCSPIPWAVWWRER